MVKLIIGL